MYHFMLIMSLQKTAAAVRKRITEVKSFSFLEESWFYHLLYAALCLFFCVLNQPLFQWTAAQDSAQTSPVC